MGKLVDYKTIFTLASNRGEVAKIEVLVAGGPLCVGPVWSWVEKEKAQGLYFIYFKRHGLPFGPFYADIMLAEKGMKKVLKAFPQAGFWGQSLEWYGRQTAFHEWIDKNLGKPGDLMGGEWIREAKSTAANTANTA